jgi:hypothetical protein
LIVDPDFLDHWRTGMVADALSDSMAPVYILRLWAHCQERKSDTFVLPTRGLKAQCKFPGDADAFEAALIDAGFITRQGDTVVVVGWAEKNASLLAAWSNGGKGGRPKKNQDETHGKPTGNPAVTQGEPIANPGETDKRREEKNNTPQAPKGAGTLFESFWNAYPKKVGKDDARKAFVKRKPDAEMLAAMVTAISSQASSAAWTKDGGQFIPNPATWLNGGRWQDGDTSPQSNVMAGAV